MSELVHKLEEIAKQVRGGSDADTIRNSIKSASAIASSQPELSEELKIWLTKLDVILKEPVGRAGMAKHAHFWAEKLKNVG